MRGGVVLVALVVLLAGCSGSKKGPEDVGASTEPAAPKQGSSAPPGTGGNSSQPDPATALPTGQETWFLHVPHGSGGLSNCGPPGAPMMNHIDIPDECDAHGSRGPLGTNAGCNTFCWPADDLVGIHPKGTPVKVVLYLTADAIENPTVKFFLTFNGTLVASSDPVTNLVVGAGGAQFAPFEANFELTEPIAGGEGLLLRAHITYTESFYVGYDDGHASKMTIQ